MSFFSLTFNIYLTLRQFLGSQIIISRGLTYNYLPQGTGKGLTRSCLCAGCAGRSSCAWPRWSATWSPTPGRNPSTARSAASSTRRRETSGWVPQTDIPYLREYLMYYIGPGFLAVPWFGSPHPPVSKYFSFSLFVCAGRAYLQGDGGGGGGGSQNKGRRETRVPKKNP